MSNNSIGLASDAMFAVSMSANDVDKETDGEPSSEGSGMTVDQLRAGIELVAQAIVSGQLDNIGRAKNVELLAKDSKVKKSAIEKDLDKAIGRFHNIPSKQKNETENKLFIELTDEDKERGGKLANATDIFKYFNDSLRDLGFPVQSRVSDSVLMSLTARLLDHSTLHVSYGPSASGKSTATLKALGFLPPEQYIIITSMSTQAAYYLGDLKGKVVMFGEMKPIYDGEDDLMQMAIRQLISENKITRTIPEKQPDGSIKSVDKITEGPCSIITSTTLEPQSFNDEFVNRGYWVQSDDSEETTTEALYAKAERAANPEAASSQKLRTRELQGEWQAFHGLLLPLPVVVPFAKKIIPGNRHVTVRRLYELLLDYVRCSALLHQHSRATITRNDVRYVVANRDDYRVAFGLLKHNGPRTLESCSLPARVTIEKARVTFGFNSFTQDQVTAQLKVPRSTAQRYIKQWIADGLAKEEESASGFSKRKCYTLTNDSGLGEQDLGLVDELPAAENF